MTTSPSDTPAVVEAALAGITPEMRSTVLSKLYFAIEHQKTLNRDSDNEFKNYKYVNSETMLAEGKKSLLAAGLLHSVLAETIEKPGDKDPRNYLRVWYILFDLDGNYVVNGPMCWSYKEMSGMPEDKASGSAKTMLVNYYLRDLLMIPRVVNPTDDMDEREPSAERPASQAPQKAPPGNPNEQPNRDQSWYVREVLKIQEACQKLDTQRARNAWDGWFATVAKGQYDPAKPQSVPRDLLIDLYTFLTGKVLPKLQKENSE